MAGFLYLNLAVAFLLELCAVAAVSYWGFHIRTGILLRFIAGIGAPALLIVVWGTYLSPKASLPLPGLWTDAAKFAVFAAAAAALYAAGRPTLAAWLFIVFAINYLIMLVAGQ